MAMQQSNDAPSMHDAQATGWANTQPDSAQARAAGNEAGEERREGGRERKSRDMYGRDRRNNRDARPRDESAPAEQGESAVAAAPVAAPAPHQEPRTQQSAPAVAAPTMLATPAAVPVARPAPAPVAAAPANTRGTTMPKIGSYSLSLPDLEQVAQNSGLQWVQSDATKIATVQAQIAAEPKPVHQPRERAPAVAISNEPLVLVETRKDLAASSFPFDQ